MPNDGSAVPGVQRDAAQRHILADVRAEGQRSQADRQTSLGGHYSGRWEVRFIWLSLLKSLIKIKRIFII